MLSSFFFFQAEDGIRDLVRSRGLGDVYKRQGGGGGSNKPKFSSDRKSSDGYKKSGFSKDRGERSDKKDFGRDRRFSRDKKR